VFVVSVFDSATAARCPDPLLPLGESLSRDTEEGATTREKPAGASIQSTTSRRAIIGSDIVGSLAASDWKFPQQQQVMENKCVVETFTKSKRAQTVDDNETCVEDQPAPTLNAFDQGDTRATTVVVGSLEARNHKGPNHEGARDGKLVTESVIAFENSYRDAARIAEGPVNTLSAKMGTGGNNTPMVAIRELPVAYSIREDAKANTFSATELDRSNALNALRPSPQSHHAQMFIAEPTMAVRRLTPVECERLMGWPDDWTSGQADTHRYKQCGNGVASPVATWIGQQLMGLDR